MTMLADRFRLWFEYERDSHRKVLVSLETLSEGQPDAESDERFQKCVDRSSLRCEFRRQRNQADPRGVIARRVPG